MTEYFYVATELARVGRIYVVTEDCYVTTKLTTTETLCRARQALGVHDRDVRTIEGLNLCHDRLVQ